MRILIFLMSLNLLGQFLDINPEIKLGTGVRAISWNKEVGYRRSYTSINIDTNFIIDKDRSFQYGFGLDIDLETRLSVTPGIYIKLEKDIYKNIYLYTLAGVSYMIVPETIFGFRIGFGSNYMLLDYLGFIFQLDIEPLLFGSGIDGKILTEFKFLFGTSILF